MPIRHPQIAYDLIGPDGKKRADGHGISSGWWKNRQQLEEYMSRNLPEGFKVENVRFVDADGKTLKDRDVLTSPDTGDVKPIEDVPADAEPAKIAPPPPGVQVANIAPAQAKLITNNDLK